MSYQIVPLKFVLTVEYLDRNDVPLLAYDAEFGDALIYHLHIVGLSPLIRMWTFGISFLSQFSSKRFCVVSGDTLWCRRTSS